MWTEGASAVRPIEPLYFRRNAEAQIKLDTFGLRHDIALFLVAGSISDGIAKRGWLDAGWRLASPHFDFAETCAKYFHKISILSGNCCCHQLEVG